MLVIALLAACAAAPTAPPQRTYDRIREDQLYPLTRAVFVAAGFRTELCPGGRVCVETAWREAGGERRMYTARYERDPVDDRYMLYLDLAVQARAPGAATWVEKPASPAQDPEYLRVLQELDLAVRRLGGVQY